MQLSEIEVIVAIADAGSLSAAARKLGLTPMTVSRRLSSLEHELGVRLLHRTTRSVSLTAEGESFLPYALTMLDAHEGARRMLAPDSTSATGLLKLTAPIVFGQSVIMPFIPAMLADNPMLRIDCTFTDEMVDISGMGLDVGIRIADLSDSSMVARRVTENPLVLCATPDYLERKGTPTTLEDLKGHSCIALHLLPQWTFSAADKQKNFKPEGIFASSNVDVVRTACLQGLGITLLSFWDVRTQIADGSLQSIILTDAKPKVSNIWAVFPTRQYVPSRVKVFLEALQKAVENEDLTRFL
jgi:DNA-binding transcriptional LysR family regulator